MATSTPLVIFIFALYVVFMCFVKHVITPSQHLFVVVGVMCLMIVITYMDGKFEVWTSNVDQWIFNPIIVDIVDTTMNRLTLFVDNDYKRSNLRRLVKRAKRYINYFLK
jgi:hypothetical protein